MKDYLGSDVNVRVKIIVQDFFSLFDQSDTVIHMLLLYTDYILVILLILYLWHRHKSQSNLIFFRPFISKLVLKFAWLFHEQSKYSELNMCKKKEKYLRANISNFATPYKFIVWSLLTCTLMDCYSKAIWLVLYLTVNKKSAHNSAFEKFDKSFPVWFSNACIIWFISMECVILNLLLLSQKEEAIF